MSSESISSAGQTFGIPSIVLCHHKSLPACIVIFRFRQLKTITVSIVVQDFNASSTTSFKGIHKQDILELSPSQKRLFGKEAIEQLYPEIYLIKVNQFDDLAKDSLDEWIYFFKNSEIKEEFKAKGLKEAEEKLKIVNMDEGEYKSYQRYLDNLRYQASIAETLKIEAEEKVRKDEKLEIARMMMKSNEPIEKIKLYTGLSEEEIEAL